MDPSKGHQGLEYLLRITVHVRSIEQACARGRHAEWVASKSSSVPFQDTITVIPNEGKSQARETQRKPSQPRCRDAMPSGPSTAYTYRQFPPPTTTLRARQLSWRLPNPSISWEPADPASLTDSQVLYPGCSALHKARQCPLIKPPSNLASSKREVSSAAFLLSVSSRGDMMDMQGKGSSCFFTV